MHPAYRTAARRRHTRLRRGVRVGKIVGDGNSLLAGVGIDNSGTSYLDGNVIQLLGARYGCPAVNFAVSGQTTTQMIGDAATQIDPAYDAANTPDVLVLWELRNEYTGTWAEQDILLTARAVLDKLWTYVDARRAAHPWAAVVVLPVLPTSQSSSNNAGHPFDNTAFETWRGQINGLLSSEAAAHGCRAPTLPDAVMAFGANHDRTYYREDIHLNAAGYALVEPYLAAAIDAAVPQGTFIADLTAAAGGSANVAGLYETGSGVTLVSGAVDSIVDARGFTGYGPSLVAPDAASRPDWDATTKEISGGSAKGLTSAAFAGFRLDADASLVAVATSPDTASGYLAALSTDATTGTITRLLAIQHNAGAGNSGTIRAVTKAAAAVIDSLVPCSAALRLTIARHSAATDGCEVRNHAAQTTASGGQQAAGANMLRWLGYANTNSSPSRSRFLMVTKTALTAPQAAAVEALVAARYGVAYTAAA